MDSTSHTPVVIPQANSLTVLLKGDAASWASSGATDDSTHTFSIANYAAVNALGNSSNANAIVTVSGATGNPQTVLRSTLTVTATPLGTTSGRVKNTADNLANITFSANSAGSVALNKTTLTLTGSAVTATSSQGISLVDENNNNVTTAYGATIAANSCNAGDCVVTWSFGANGFQISAGSSYPFTVRMNTLTNTNPGQSNSSVSLGVTIQANTDVQYTDGLDNSATTGLPLPSTATPIQVNSITFAQGT
jgi:hypothetical protein